MKRIMSLVLLLLSLAATPAAAIEILINKHTCPTRADCPEVYKNWDAARESDQTTGGPNGGSRYDCPAGTYKNMTTNWCLPIYSPPSYDYYYYYYRWRR